jgi:hypothetical protein
MRFAAAALLALLLAVRSLAPQGFMPQFDRGALTIVACPDSSPAVAAQFHQRHHHPADHRLAHEPCPYAAVSQLGATGADWGGFAIGALFFAALLLLGRSVHFIERHSNHERPPAIGPPVIS